MFGVSVKYRKDAIQDAARNILDSVLDAVQIEVWGRSAEEAPVDTGKLSTSFEIRKPRDLFRSVFTRVPYAEAVHQGRGARIIRPVNKKALYWKGARHPVKKVRQKAVKGNQFFFRAIDRAETRLDEFARAAVDEHLIKTAGG
jgi:hypothetical protein